jgi:hypothetical protein
MFQVVFSTSFAVVKREGDGSIYFALTTRGGVGGCDEFHGVYYDEFISLPEGFR